MASDVNPRLDYFLNYLPNITAPGSGILVETPFPLDYFLPRNKKMFYRFVINMFPLFENSLIRIFFLQNEDTLGP